jgi:RNA polymerase sigma factor (TIGR02999 family)
MEIDALIRELLGRLGDGDEAAQDRLFEVLYGELHALAHRVRRSRRADGDMRTTELVGALFLKLRAAGTVRLNDTNHFYSLAALMMRQALADEAERLLADKRGGGVQPVTLDDERLAGDSAHERALEVIALEGAVRRLDRERPELGRTVGLRYFLECTIEEAAQIMNCSPRTIVRHDAEARGLLRSYLDPDGDSRSGSEPPPVVPR